MDDVGPVILGSRCRNAPHARLDINFGPLELSYFLAALTRQCEELNDTAERPWHLASGDYYFCELLVGQDPVAADLSIWRRNTFGRRKIDHGAADAPPKEGLECLQQPVTRVGISLRNLI